MVNTDKKSILNDLLEKGKLDDPGFNSFMETYLKVQFLGNISSSTKGVSS
jgi:hypothetical protein